MASSGSITTNECQGRSVTLSWSLSSQSIEKKYINYIMGIKRFGSGGGWVKSGGFKAVINGTTVYSTSTDSRIQLYNGTTVASGSITIAHNADGTKIIQSELSGGCLYLCGKCNGKWYAYVKYYPKSFVSKSIKC